MRTMAADSVDSIVTDPPYGIKFMGKGWDHGVPGVPFWVEALRVAKPGAYLVAFGGTRTFHRLAVAIEDAGWEIRDTLMWVYGSGFPKSLDVGKAIDAHLGKEREVVGFDPRSKGMKPGANNWGGCGPKFKAGHDITAPTSEQAKQWDGWGTALKPAWEPILMARKPLPGTVAENVIKHGTGGINIEACRVEGVADVPFGTRHDRENTSSAPMVSRKDNPNEWVGSTNGRWPANPIHDGSEEVVRHFPEAPGQQRDVQGDEGRTGGMAYGVFSASKPFQARGDEGNASRFFYCAKASKADRDEGLAGFEEGYVDRGNGFSKAISATKLPRANTHPTVKPTELMRWLCRLVTQPRGVVFDPFMGSGSTGKAAACEGFDFIGCDLEADHVAIATARCAYGERIRHEELGLFAHT